MDTVSRSNTSSQAAMVELPLGLEECQQVRVTLVLMRVGEAVGGGTP